jgi:hypothetical protein
MFYFKYYEYKQKIKYQISNIKHFKTYQLKNQITLKNLITIIHIPQSN